MIASRSSLRFLALVLFALGLSGCAGGEAGEQKEGYKSMNQIHRTPVESMAAGLGVEAAAVLSAQWLSATGDPQWVVGVFDDRGVRRAALSAGDSGIVLARGGDVELLAAVDLAGEERALILADVPPSNGIVTEDEWSRPGLLLRVKDKRADGLEEDTLVLVAVEAPPQALWREVSRSVPPQGGGFQSHELRFVQAEGDLLGVTLYQAALPRAGATQNRPGPPKQLRFEYRGGTYQRIP